MTLSGTESGVEALSDSELQLYESYTTRAWATLLPPTAWERRYGSIRTINLKYNPAPSLPRRQWESSRQIWRRATVGRGLQRDHRRRFKSRSRVWSAPVVCYAHATPQTSQRHTNVNPARHQLQKQSRLERRDAAWVRRRRCCRRRKAIIRTDTRTAPFARPHAWFPPAPTIVWIALLAPRHGHRRSLPTGARRE